VVHMGRRRGREERPKPRDRSGRVARSNEGRRRRHGQASAPASTRSRRS
jgi:hypothetical protein